MPEKPQKPREQSQTVLLVEPDPRYRSGLEVSLRRYQFKVVGTGDAASALRELEKAPVSAALVECNLPNDCGFKLCRALLETGKVPVVVMMNARPTRHTVLGAVRAGAMEFVAKPARAELLYIKLKKAYARTQPDSAASERPEIDFGKASISPGEKVDIVMKRAATIRALPHAVMKILQLIAADDSDADDLGRAVESDPSIAAMMMKRARSSYYSRGKPVTELRQAVVRLGFKECADMVISLSVFKLFENQDKTFGFSRTGFWLHSISCGLLATQIAKQAGIKHAEKAMMVGLLHDIGKMILDDFLTEEFQVAVRTAATQRQSLFDAEKAVLERTHADVGAAVVERWRFPSIVAEVILDHHRHEKFLTQTPGSPSLSGAVHLANQMSKALMMGEAGDFLVQDIPAAVWQSYGFEQPPGGPFLESFHRQLKEYCAFLDMPDDDLGVSFEPAQDRGVAAILDPNNTNTYLMKLFLTNLGFRVTAISDPSQLFAQGEPVRLCLLRPSDEAMAVEMLSAMDGAGEECPLTICILADDGAARALSEGRPWLRIVSTPIDCFELHSHIIAPVPAVEAATA